MNPLAVYYLIVLSIVLVLACLNYMRRKALGEKLDERGENISRLAAKKTLQVLQVFVGLMLFYEAFWGRERCIVLVIVALISFFLPTILEIHYSRVM
ncbi:hypothetical protein [Thermococcus litoralis]|uniref:hypothetical protein n=1 Tax=Thermococcus litoralis TaxID=2265 RepID=UPI000B3559BD|nr:hypothetical protein [Thermococcus litoralis]